VIRLFFGYNVGSSTLECPTVKTKCPHCSSDCVIRDSEQLSDLVRRIKFACTDPDCGHTFKATLEVTHSLSASSKPNPTIRLPFASHVDTTKIVASVQNA